MDPYSPSSVPLAGLTEAAAAGVYLALEEQQFNQAASNEADIGTTTGYVPPPPPDL